MHLSLLYAKIMGVRELNIESAENWVTPSFLLVIIPTVKIALSFFQKSTNLTALGIKEIYGVRYQHDNRAKNAKERIRPRFQ